MVGSSVISPIYVGMSVGIDIVQVFLGQPYCWDFKSAASCLVLEVTILLQTSWSSHSYNVPTPYSVMFPSIACMSCAIDVPAGAWHIRDSCSGHFNWLDIGEWSLMWKEASLMRGESYTLCILSVCGYKGENVEHRSCTGLREWQQQLSSETRDLTSHEGFTSLK